MILDIGDVKNLEKPSKRTQTIFLASFYLAYNSKYSNIFEIDTFNYFKGRHFPSETVIYFYLFIS